MRSIRSKILLSIGGIILAGMIISGVFVVSMTNKTVKESEAYILEGSTQNITENINTYFQHYVSTMQQMAKDQNVINLVTSGVTIEGLTSSPYYSSVKAMMQRTVEADSNPNASYLVGSLNSQWGFNEGDWIASFNLADKAYGFNSQEDLDHGMIFTEPYQDNVTGEMVTTMAVPIFDSENRYVGVIASDLQIADVSAMVIESESTYSTGYQMLISDTGAVLAHKDQDKVLKKITEIGLSKEMTDAVTKNTKEKVIAFEDNGTASYGTLCNAEFTGWKILSVVPEENYLQAVNTMTKTLFVSYAICAVILGLIIFFIANGIVAPLKKLTVVTEQMAQGKLDVEVDVKSKDEIGRLAVALKSLTERLNQYIVYIDEVSGALGEFGKGNLNIKLYQAYDGEFQKLKDAMLQTAAIFSQSIGRILQISDQVSTGSDQVASGAQMLAQGATEQASSIEELSATIQEISNNVTSNAEHARDAAQQVKTVGDAADHSNEQMRQMIKAIQEINDKSAEIGKIIKTIDDIAFQTNILALNAAVEAARAGQAGKGFAVVADEVRNLASKSAEAAKLTTALIEDSMRAVENGTVIADETEKILADVLEGVTQTVGLIDEISTASSVQANTISQILLGVEQISSVVQTNSATAEESSAASEELAGQATMLKNVSAQFKLD